MQVPAYRLQSEQETGGRYKMSEIYDIAILGAGPAGISAVIYAARARLKILWLDKQFTVGGQIQNTYEVDNYPGLPGISGMDLGEAFENHAQKLGVSPVRENVLAVEDTGAEKIIRTKKNEYRARTVVLACGASHRMLEIPGEQEFSGMGVSYCATCDGAFFRDQNVVVIGDANSALQYAIALSEICKHVQIMTLFDRYFADPILVKRVQENPKISAEHEWSAIRFEGNKDLTGVTFQNTKTKEIQTIPCQGCFIAIGQIPHNDAYASFVDLNRGFIVTDENMATKTPGLFACGDTRVKKVRQVATAIGDGANAAMNCLAYLSSLVAA